MTAHDPLMGVHSHANCSRNDVHAWGCDMETGLCCFFQEGVPFPSCHCLFWTAEVCSFRFVCPSANCDSIFFFYRRCEFLKLSYECFGFVGRCCNPDKCVHSVHIFIYEPSSSSSSRMSMIVSFHTRVNRIWRRRENRLIPARSAASWASQRLYRNSFKEVGRISFSDLQKLRTASWAGE